MKILGLHFGHDAGVAVIEDGKVLFLAHAERLIGKKHASGLSYDLLVGVFERAGLHFEQIDFCAITSTQGMDIILDGRLPFQIELARHPSDLIPSAVESVTNQLLAKDPNFAIGRLLDPFGGSSMGALRLEGAVEDSGIPAEHVVAIPTLNQGILNKDSALARKSPLRRLGEYLPSKIESFAAHKFDFNFPVTLVLEGRKIPAALISHHAAHAGGVYYQSPYQTSPIITIDGGSGRIEGGLFWLGRGNEILPLRHHHLELGRIYQFAGHNTLKLGGAAAAGKMMGLAPYGTPAFFDARFVANLYDEIADGDLAARWMEHMMSKIRQSSHYIHADLSDPLRMTTPINADIAASTQKLFEETMIVAAEQLSNILSDIGSPSDKLCLSGGCMLNCPSNTRLSQETHFRDVYIEPACDDGGLPAGAAFWAYYNLMGHERIPAEPIKQGVPYLGLPIPPSDYEVALSSYGDQIVVSQHTDIAQEGARRLVAGQVLGWFEGRSEIGCRALGHRSIVADPRSAEMWQRVNTIKGRELWRPLAPSVLAEHSTDWFSGLPAASPFMMFVGTVTRPDVPAISHIDGTARVQTVGPECGGYYKLLNHFHMLTGCAVVLNTSMNGPGEPIAEYPSDAIRLLVEKRFDCLVLENMIIERTV